MLGYPMRETIGTNSQEIGFKLYQKRSTRHNPNIITKLDFSDDIALVTEKMEQVQDFLYPVQHNSAKTGLYQNAD